MDGFFSLKQSTARACDLLLNGGRALVRAGLHRRSRAGAERALVSESAPRGGVS